MSNIGAPQKACSGSLITPLIIGRVPLLWYPSNEGINCNWRRRGSLNQGSEGEGLMRASPRVVFGLPAYNHAHKLKEALDSILLQTQHDFCLLVSDDSSTDETQHILEEYAARDDRIVYRRTERRLGYIGNARRCFELARELYPHAEFFAWASDHDIWHPRWLEALEHALDRHRDAIIACPLVYRIDADGSILSAQPTSRQCTTVGEAPSVRRFSKTFNKLMAGNMIYGLMRADALEKAGVLPWHLLPDRLLLVLLSFYGTMVSVPEYLWYRRYSGLASIDRQIRSSFLGSPPGYLRLPWCVAHTGHLFTKLVLFPRPDAPFGRSRGAVYSALYLLLGVKHVLTHGMRRSLYKACVAMIPGQPRQYLRSVFAPALGRVFRRQKL
jgi:glycosyltransferase involved in cell wall biosynthesis